MTRGFNLLGILIMNITSFFSNRNGVYEPHITLAIEKSKIFLVNFITNDYTRFMSIFSILFGDVVLFTQRIFFAKRVAALHFRRMFWLLPFGLIHAYFIWVGDILVAYAICGSFVFFFRKKSIQTLVILTLILFLIPISLNFITYLFNANR